ncbi:glycosyltransferase [Nocardia asteroides]
MRALLAFTGSRGDAQPGILLARTLRARGHEVTLALAPNLVGFATGHGIAAVPFGRDSAELLAAQRTDPRFGSRDPRARLRAVVDLQRRGVPEMLADLRSLVPGLDVVVAGMAGEEAAAAVAGEAGLPFAALHFFPIQPTTVVPVVPAPWADAIPGVVNRVAWSALARARAGALAPVLPTGRPTPYTRIQAYEPELFPGLAAEIDGPFTGFPIDVDGFFTATADSALPPVCPERHRGHPGPETPAGGDSSPVGTVAPYEAHGRSSSALHRWLADGSAPIYVGFGSMDVGDPAEFVALLRAVCARRNRRLLLASGWAAITPGIGAEVAIVDQVDHTTVLPRCVAAVHHGGAGTTAAALRAGVPQVICSVQADQPYWGQALRRLGLAAALPARELTGPRLDAALDRISTPAVRRRSAEYAALFRTDGVARAADAVEALIPHRSALVHTAGRSA